MEDNSNSYPGLCCQFDCDEPARTLGMCDAHYRRYKKGLRGEFLTAPINRYSGLGVDIPPPSSIKPGFSKDAPLTDYIFKFIRARRGEPVTFEILSDAFDVSVGKVRTALAGLTAAGKNVHVDEGFGTASLPADIPSAGDTRIDVSKFHGDLVSYGLTADNHLCSKYSRMDVLNALFDIWAEQGVKTVLQAGNMIDGECRFNRFDLVTRPGIDAQAEYLMNEWPVRKGITTEFVCGDDHEGWYVQREGINIVSYLQNTAHDAGRGDMKFMSYMEHTYSMQAPNGASNMVVQHAGGGSAYATSYTVQKIVESYQPNEKPTILIVGHFHKAEFGYPRSVLTVQAGCTQDQSPFLRKKRIEAMVGGWTLSFTVDNNGIVHGFAPQWHPFYDRDFYSRWSYHWKPKATK